jgi:hypothetical protein
MVSNQGFVSNKTEASVLEMTMMPKEVEAGARLLQLE